jgi:beta-1,4-glucosyltransferase
MEAVESLRIAGYTVHSTTREVLATHLLEQVAHGRKQLLFFANTNFIVKGRPLLGALSSAPVLLVNDGVGMDIAALLVQRHRFPHNLNGTDFTPYLFQRAPRPLRVFLLGSVAPVLAGAARHLTDKLGQVVVGTCDGFDGVRNEAALLAQLEAARPDVVLVAMGNPLQEQWILQHYQQVPAALFMGIGALFEFWSGGKSRAPGWVQSLRLEWLYRLSLEPRRLLRRYTYDIVVFLGHCLRYR